MNKFLLLFSASILFAHCSFTEPQDDLTIKKAEGFPQWLYGADQTSGIAFIGLDNVGNKNFLVADDVGKLHRMVIINDTVISLKPVVLGEEVVRFLSPFPKWDFEEIVYDKYTGNVYLSIEGNGELFRDFTGIFRINFSGSSIFSDTVVSIEKMQFSPSGQFLANVGKNIGYEGVTVDENYFYLGLEGFQSESLFADSTLIYIAQKNSLTIIDSVNTKEFGISTVCGLYSDKNNSVYGIDRNSKKLFHFILNNNHKVVNYAVQEIASDMPGYHYNYTSALESVTMDNEKNIYLTDDPWKKFYMPSEEILNKTDQKTRENFKSAIPIIYKFKTTF